MAEPAAPLRLDRRPATDADVPFLLALRRATMDPRLAAAGEVLDEAQHRARLLYRFECVEVLELDARPVGMLKLLRGARTWEILQLQVAAELQNRGAGRALLAELIAQAAEAGTVLRLCVLKDNPARRLYESMGFRHVGEDAREFHLQRDP